MARHSSSRVAGRYVDLICRAASLQFLAKLFVFAEVSFILKLKIIYFSQKLTSTVSYLSVRVSV